MQPLSVLGIVFGFGLISQPLDRGDDIKPAGMLNMLVGDRPS